MLFMALIMSLPIMAQQHRVTGVVVDQKDGSAIIGANVTEKGTKNGTVADVNGNFTIDVTSARPTLVITSVGYKTVEVVVGSQSFVRVTIVEEVSLLDEVVVVGYGTMKKSDLSGASVSVSEEKIKGSIITNLDQVFQGRAAGVTSVITSGAPGSSVSIRVRGQSTINANAEPLYVIDGVIVQGGGNSGASFGLGDALKTEVHLPFHPFPPSVRPTLCLWKS